jgi:hypothetical protein
VEDYYTKLNAMKNKAKAEKDDEDGGKAGLNPRGKKLPDISGLIQKPTVKVKVKVGSR